MRRGAPLEKLAEARELSQQVLAARAEVKLNSIRHMMEAGFSNHKIAAALGYSTTECFRRFVRKRAGGMAKLRGECNAQ